MSNCDAVTREVMLERRLANTILERREWRRLFFWPRVIAAAPAPIGHWLTRFLAGLPQNDEVEMQALATWWGGGVDGKRRHARFMRRARYARIAERADTVLAGWRGAAWWKRRVTCLGDWPVPDGGALLLAAHWGGGPWLWRVLQAHRRRGWFVAKPAGAGDFGRHGSAAAAAYCRWRARQIGERCGCAGVITTGGAAEQVLSAWQHGDIVVGMLDLPAGDRQSGCVVQFRGERVRWRCGLAVLAARHNIPIYAISCGTDPDTGRRLLAAVRLTGTVEDILQGYADVLASDIRREPSGWLAWPGPAAC